MPYALVQDVAASWHRYDRFAASMAPPPEGLILHVAGPTDEGFRIIEVWESEADWERFKAELPPDEPPVDGRSHASPVFRALRPVHIVHGRSRR